jgi:hypothetical protein
MTKFGSESKLMGQIGVTLVLAQKKTSSSFHAYFPTIVELQHATFLDLSDPSSP